MTSCDQERVADPRPRVPAPILVVLGLLLLAGPIAFVVGDEAPAQEPQSGPTLAQIARAAGCHVTEFNDDMKTNPPVTGRFIERARVADGSYAGQKPPSLEDTLHAMFHGRVLFQYRPGLPAQQLRALDRLTRKAPDKVLLFANQTGMPAPVAATAYLSVMTCPRVDDHVLHALDEFRTRRRDFGQSF